MSSESRSTIRNALEQLVNDCQAGFIHLADGAIVHATPIAVSCGLDSAGEPIWYVLAVREDDSADSSYIMIAINSIVSIAPRYA